MINKSINRTENAFIVTLYVEIIKNENDKTLLTYANIAIARLSLHNKILRQEFVKRRAIHLLANILKRYNNSNVNQTLKNKDENFGLSIIHALLNFSVTAENQSIICILALDDIIKVIQSRTKAKGLAIKLLKNLQKNKKNRTQIYKKELLMKSTRKLNASDNQISTRLKGRALISPYKI